MRSRTIIKQNMTRFHYDLTLRHGTGPVTSLASGTSKQLKCPIIELSSHGSINLQFAWRIQTLSFRCGRSRSDRCINGTSKLVERLQRQPSTSFSATRNLNITIEYAECTRFPMYDQHPRFPTFRLGTRSPSRIVISPHRSLSRTGNRQTKRYWLWLFIWRVWAIQTVLTTHDNSQQL
jgi:hypothetical protein